MDSAAAFPRTRDKRAAHDLTSSSTAIACIRVCTEPCVSKYAVRISALLVRQVFDTALFVQRGPDLGALYPLVAVLIAIPIINGILNIVQVYLTEVVGNRVLQELRDRLFEHLEKLSLALYTATRSGEVQSRLPTTSAGCRP